VGSIKIGAGCCEKIKASSALVSQTISRPAGRVPHHPEPPISRRTSATPRSSCRSRRRRPSGGRSMRMLKTRRLTSARGRRHSPTAGSHACARLQNPRPSIDKDFRVADILDRSRKENADPGPPAPRPPLTKTARALATTKKKPRKRREGVAQSSSIRIAPLGARKTIRPRHDPTGCPPSRWRGRRMRETA